MQLFIFQIVLLRTLQNFMQDLFFKVNQYDEYFNSAETVFSSNCILKIYYCLHVVPKKKGIGDSVK